MIDILSFLDLIIVVLLIVAGFLYVRKTVLTNLYIFFVLLYVLSQIFNNIGMWRLSNFIFWALNLSIIALLIVFQPELRKIALQFASLDIRVKTFLQRKVLKNGKKKTTETNWEPVITALQNMQSERIGAIFIFARKSSLSFYAESGVLMDAQINARLLESIFQPQSPLHDGAVIIKNNRILSASAILPVSEGKAISGRKGLRHRAAIGLVERTDAVAIVISEETGEILLAYDDFIEENISVENLRKRLKRIFTQED